MSIREKLLECGYGDEDTLFMPKELDKAYIGIAMTDWHFGRPLYDLAKLEDTEIPKTPEGMKEPIFVNCINDINEYPDTIVFDPKEHLNEAIIGITDQGQAVYEYIHLIDSYLEAEPDWDEMDAIDWISYNTLRDYSYREQGPIVFETLEGIVQPLDED